MDKDTMKTYEVTAVVAKGMEASKTVTRNITSTSPDEAVELMEIAMKERMKRRVEAKKGRV